MATQEILRRVCRDKTIIVGRKADDSSFTVLMVYVRGSDVAHVSIKSDAHGLWGWNYSQYSWEPIEMVEAEYRLAMVRPMSNYSWTIVENYLHDMVG